MNQLKKRKLQNKEIERKKKLRAKLTAMIFAAIGVFIVAAIAWVAWDTHSRSWIMRFDGQRIPIGEYRVWLPANPTDAEREATLDYLKEALVLLDRAEYHGMGLTDEERDFWSWLLTMQHGPAHFVTDERLAELFAAHAGEVWQRLAAHYIPDMFIFLDEQELMEDLAEYKEANLLDYVNTTVYYVMLDNFELAVDAYMRYRAGEVTFYDLLHEFNPEWLETEEEWPTFLLSAVIDEFQLDEDYAQMLLALETGEISAPIAWGEFFGIDASVLFYIAERVDADEAEIERGFRERAAAAERNRLFAEQLPRWVEEADITVNRRAMARA